MSWSTHISMTTCNSDEPSETGKKLAIADRSAAFCYRLDSLLDLTDIASLRFISEMVERFEEADAAFENTHFESNDFDLEDDCPFNPYQKVILNPMQLDPIIADIDRFILWCGNNTSEASKVFRDDGYNEDDLKQGMAKSVNYSTYHYDSQASGEPDFLFCTLKSMQDILKYAKENNLSVTYENLAEC